MLRRTVFVGACACVASASFAQQVIPAARLVGKWNLGTAVELTFTRVDPDGTAWGEFLDRTGSQPKTWPMGKWIANTTAGASYVDGVLRIKTWDENTFELKPTDANTLSGAYRRSTVNPGVRSVTFKRM